MYNRDLQDAPRGDPMTDSTRVPPTVADCTPPVDRATAGPASGRPAHATPAPTADDIDRAFRAALAKLTGGLSPSTYLTAWTDWATQLAASPGRQWELQQEAMRRAMDTWSFAARAAAGQPATPNEGLDGAADARFAGEAWSQYPYNVWARAF